MNSGMMNFGSMARYRRLDSRYTMVVRLPPFSAAWRLERWSVTLAEPRWRPEADVYETPSAIRVTVALAGVQAEEVEVLLFDDAVVIEGFRRLACEEAGVYRAAEIPQGPFRVEIAVPAVVEAEGVDVQFEQGLLRVTLPKAEHLQ